MAVRYRKDRKKWQTYWDDPKTGQRKSRMFDTKLEAEKLDDTIKFKKKYEPESFLAAEEENVEEENSLENILFAYLREKRYEKKSLRWIMGCMEIPLKVLGTKKIEEITRQDLSKVLEVMMAQKARDHTGKETDRLLKPVTVRDRMKMFHTVLTWSMKRGYVEYLPVFPELPHATYERIKPPSQEEIKKLLESAPPHIQRVIVLGFQFGMRVGPSELFNLKWEDVDIDGRVVHVKAADKNENEPWRDVPIKESLVPIFKSWCEEDMQKGCEYVVNYHNKGITNLRYGWAGTKKRAGITRKMRPYDLRHAFATEAIAAGADYGTVAKLMGHASAQMVLQFYQHVMTEQKKRAIETLPDIDDSLLKCAHKNVPTISVSTLQ